MKFEFKGYKPYCLTKEIQAEITYATEANNLEEIMQEFALFLNGCGYAVDPIIEPGESND